MPRWQPFIRTSAIAVQLLNEIGVRNSRLFVGPQPARMSERREEFPVALAVEPGKPEVAVKHKAGNFLAAFCLAPSKAQPATTCQRNHTR